MTSPPTAAPWSAWVARQHRVMGGGSLGLLPLGLLLPVGDKRPPWCWTRRSSVARWRAELATARLFGLGITFWGRKVPVVRSEQCDRRAEHRYPVVGAARAFQQVADCAAGPSQAGWTIH
ncbi:MAG: hypothetical protein ACR2MN_01005 [Acidimicrobiales bacterium]